MSIILPILALAMLEAYLHRRGYLSSEAIVAHWRDDNAA